MDGKSLVIVAFIGVFAFPAYAQTSEIREHSLQWLEAYNMAAEVADDVYSGPDSARKKALLSAIEDLEFHATKSIRPSSRHSCSQAVGWMRETVKSGSFKTKIEWRVWEKKCKQSIERL